VRFSRLGSEKGEALAEGQGVAVAGGSEIFLNRRGWLWSGFVAVAVALAFDVLYREDWRLAIDFHTYFAAALIGLQNGWSHLYDQSIIAAEQKQLVPGLWSQPYLSPPVVAWLAAPLTSLPFGVAFMVWALVTFAALALSFAWASTSRGLGRWIAVVGALSPFWVMHAVRVGQVVPLVAAALVVAWRLLGQKNDLGAGLILAAIVLKPNTAALVPLALLIAGRQRAFLAWLGASALVLIIMALTVGPFGMSAYVDQLLGPVSPGADRLTLHGGMGASGASATVMRLLIVGAVLLTAHRLRGSPNLILPIAIVGSLLIAPYLHTADLCLLSAAGFMLWEDRPTAAWRIPLVAVWVLASPFLYEVGLTPSMNRWPWLELAFLIALVAVAWSPLTAGADSRRPAPA
jgi:hypothetical protein